METKICSKCGVEKNIEEFAYRDKSKGTRRAECKQCISARQKVKYHRLKEELNEYKTAQCCAKCGENRPYVLDFHHVNPDIKMNTVSRLSSRSNSGPAWQEVNKCICLCANCHREFHFLEKEEDITLEEYLSS